MQTDNRKIHIYTDGSSSLKQKKGGSGIYIEFKDSEEEIKLSYPVLNIKTGQSECLAALFAFQYLLKNQYKNCDISFYIDSKYVLNSIREWIPSWIVSKFAGKQNKELMLMIYYLKSKLSDSCLKFHHVKGHTGVRGNEIADQLANCWRSAEESKFFDINDFVSDLSKHIQNNDLENKMIEHVKKYYYGGKQ